MQLGMVGLGRMGANIVRRLMRAGHACVVYDRHADATQAMAEEGASGATSPEEFVRRLDKPRTVWMMVPAGAVAQTLTDLTALLEPGDILIDGGNSYYKDTIARAKGLKPKGIHYLDVGTSGGVWGLERGYCLMIGGAAEAVSQLDPIFAALAPGPDSAPRTEGRGGTPSASEQGYLHCGPSGAGHFVKMVHNGIEYGIMAAYAEGFNILKHANVGTHEQAVDAETAPLRNPQAYPYDIDVAEVAELWRRGSVIASWLLDLAAGALARDPQLATFGGRVADSGEGRWTTIAAIEAGVPAHVLSAALFDRFSSRGEADFGNKLLSAMRHAFGGHHEQQGSG